MLGLSSSVLSTSSLTSSSSPLCRMQTKEISKLSVYRRGVKLCVFVCVCVRACNRVCMCMCMVCCHVFVFVM